MASEQTTLDDSERQPCEIWSRVMGYHRPITSWNAGKQGEWEERQAFKEGPGDREDAGDD